MRNIYVIVKTSDDYDESLNCDIIFTNYKSKYLFNEYYFYNSNCLMKLKELLFYLNLKNIDVELLEEFDGFNSYGLYFNNNSLCDCYRRECLTIEEINRIRNIIENNFIKEKDFFCKG